MPSGSIYNLGDMLGRTEKHPGYMRPLFRVEIDSDTVITPSGTRIGDNIEPGICVTSIRTYASLDALTNDAKIELSAPLILENVPETVKIFLGYDSDDDLLLVYTGNVEEIVTGTTNYISARSHASHVMKTRTNLTINQKASDEVIRKLIVDNCNVKESSKPRERCEIHKSKYIVPHSMTVFDYAKKLCEEADLWLYMNQKDELVLTRHAPKPLPDRTRLKDEINSGSAEQFSHSIDPGEVIEWAFSTRGSDVEVYTVSYAEYGSNTENLLQSEYDLIKGPPPQEDKKVKESIFLPYTPKDVAEKVLRNLKIRRAKRVVGDFLLLGRPEIRVCDSISVGDYRNGIVHRVVHTFNSSSGFVTEVEAEFRSSSE